MSKQKFKIDWERFKTTVHSNGYTLESLGEATGLGRRNIENIKNHDPSFSKIIKIADTLCVSLDELR